MKTGRLLLILFAVWGIGIAVSVRTAGNDADLRFDTVAANQVLKTVESRWGEIGQSNFSGITQQFVVLDRNGAVLYRTADNLPETVNDALRARDAVLDVTVDGQVAGKLIIHDNYEQIIQGMNQRQSVIAVTVISALALLCGLYVLYLHRSILHPFQKLQNFALQIARGNLDVPLSIGKSNPFGAFTESFDIMREELASARQSEYEANRSKKELVASLSHDVKTPVASIKTVSELMLLRADDEKTIKQLHVISSKAEQINLLVTDMFHATLEELQELKVNLTEEYSTIVQEMIRNASYDDRIVCEPVPECILLTDPLRLQQVIDNVLSNSYKYAGTAIQITSCLTPTHLQVEIMDYGQGLPSDELPLIFNKYYRGSNTKGRSGAGLGLFISRYLMRSMQGDIECHNRAGGFTVILQIKLV